MMNDILEFGRLILLIAGALSLAILVRVVAARIGLPMCMRYRTGA